MDDKTFFTVMIESIEPEQSFIQVFWTSGKHPGKAIEKVLRACDGLGIKNAYASELDSSDFKSLPRNVVRLVEFGCGKVSRSYNLEINDYDDLTNGFRSSLCPFCS